MINRILGVNPNEGHFATAVAAGAMTGMIGGMFSRPIFSLSIRITHGGHHGGSKNRRPCRQDHKSSMLTFLAGLGSPLFLVKARIQAYSPALPVGAQHYYRNSFHALSTIMKADGITGLWRGVNAAFLRTAMVRQRASPSHCPDSPRVSQSKRPGIEGIWQAFSPALSQVALTSGLFGTTPLIQLCERHPSWTGLGPRCVWHVFGC
jgi:hypothetical protein